MMIKLSISYTEEDLSKLHNPMPSDFTDCSFLLRSQTSKAFPGALLPMGKLSLFNMENIT